MAWSIAFPRPTLVLMIAKGVSKRDRMQYGKTKPAHFYMLKGSPGDRGGYEARYTSCQEER